jgi:hypothetical protein
VARLGEHVLVTRALARLAAKSTLPPGLY